MKANYFSTISTRLLPAALAPAAAMLPATAGFSDRLNTGQKSSLLARRPHPQLRLHICHRRNRGAMLPESFSRPTLGGARRIDFNVKVIRFRHMLSNMFSYTNRYDLKYKCLNSRLA